MTSAVATGMFGVCASGDVSIQIKCDGPICGGLQSVPGVTCTNDTTSVKCDNNVVCAGASNLTSSISIQQTNLTVSQKQNVTIGDQKFILSGYGSNFTSLNATTASARSETASWRLSRRNPLLKLLVCIVVMMLATQAAAQSPFSGVESQFSGALGALLVPLELSLCNHVAGETISDPFQKAGLEAEALATCLSLLAAAELTANGALVSAAGGAAAAAGGLAIGGTLPITDPATLLGAIVVDGAACMALVYVIFNAPFHQSGSQACDALISSQTSTPIQTAISTTSTSTTPESTTPESTTPESTTPESTTPEAPTPEATTPEPTTPTSTTSTSTTSTSTISIPSSTPNPIEGPSPGCSACDAGENCCLYNPDSLAPTCICGIISVDCPNNATFCPLTSIDSTSTTSTSTIWTSTTPTSTTPTSTTSTSTIPEVPNPEAPTPQAPNPEAPTPEVTTPSPTPNPLPGPSTGCSGCGGGGCCLIPGLAPTCVCAGYTSADCGPPNIFCP